MSRITRRFAKLKADKRAGLVIYVTAGDPEPGLTVKLMHALVAGGADVIELGIPFSDPLADGPVIQRATERALEAGATLVAQDEKTSVVWGMPGAVAMAGLCSAVLPLGELALFTQQIASLLSAGLPLVQCLEALQDQTEDPCFRIIIRDVRLDISSGNSFSASFADMDLDGDLDMFVGRWGTYWGDLDRLTEKTGHLWLNDGAGYFIDASGPAGLSAFTTLQGESVFDWWTFTGNFADVVKHAVLCRALHDGTMPFPRGMRFFVELV